MRTDGARRAAASVGSSPTRAALAVSHLRDLPCEVVSALTEGARRLSVPAGDALHLAGEGLRHVELVVEGLIRVHATAPDGRTLTVRYCRTGALMGVLSLYSEPFVMPADRATTIDLWRGSDYEAVVVPPAAEYQIMVEEFGESLLTGKPPRYPAEDAVHMMRILDALREQVT